MGAATTHPQRAPSSSIGARSVPPAAWRPASGGSPARGGGDDLGRAAAAHHGALGAAGEHGDLAGDAVEDGIGLDARRGDGADPAQRAAHLLGAHAVGQVLDGRHVGADATALAARGGDADDRGEAGAVRAGQHHVALGGAGAGGLGQCGGQAGPLLLGPVGEQGAPAHELLAGDAGHGAEAVVDLHDRGVGGEDHEAVGQGGEHRGGPLPLPRGGRDRAAHAAPHPAGPQRDGEPGGQVAGAHRAQEAVVGAGLEGGGRVGLGALLDEGDQVGGALAGLAGREQVGPEGLQARPVGEDDPGRADAPAAQRVGVAGARLGPPAGDLEQGAQAGA